MSAIQLFCCRDGFPMAIQLGAVLGHLPYIGTYLGRYYARWEDFRLYPAISVDNKTAFGRACSILRKPGQTQVVTGQLRDMPYQVQAVPGM